MHWRAFVTTVLIATVAIVIAVYLGVLKQP